RLIHILDFFCLRWLTFSDCRAEHETEISGRNVICRIQNDLKERSISANPTASTAAKVAARFIRWTPSVATTPPPESCGRKRPRTHRCSYQSATQASDFESADR